MSPEEKIEELYDRIWFYKDKLITNESVISNVRKELMTSHIPIEEGMFIMNMLNFIDEGTCKSDSYFLPKELTNQELKRVLEVI